MSIACGGHPLPVHVHEPPARTPSARPGALLGVFPERSGTVDTVQSMPATSSCSTPTGPPISPPPNGSPRPSSPSWSSAAATRSTADELADRIQDELERVLPFTARNDDIALLILRASGLGLTGEQ